MAQDTNITERSLSLESCRRCHSYHAAAVGQGAAAALVLDIAAPDHDSPWRQVFDNPHFTYRTIDPATVDANGTSESLYRIPLPDASADIVLASQSADHPGFVWRIIPEMLRVLRPDGWIFLTLPFAGLIHRYPNDRYRFFPDACQALADFARCTPVAGWDDDRAPWHDRVGVFRRADAPPLPHLPPQAPTPVPVASSAYNDQPGSDAEEVTSGSAPYLDVLARLHKELAPAYYLEVGVRSGNSLALARCRATGVDPAPQVDVFLRPRTEIVQSTSDAYFARRPAMHPDFAFIDGMHWFEYALRDFMNIERDAAPGAVVAIDDIFPNHAAQAERDRRTIAWTGDVWRLVDILRTWRPDLFLLPIDTSPTGLLLVAGLDPANRVLWDSYNAITRTAFATPGPPPRVIAREGAVPPDSDTLRRTIETLKSVRAAGCPPREIVSRLRQATAPDDGAPVRAQGGAPKVSLIVIGYNMPRELPRTIRSLSPAMQRGIDPGDYEIILIDNGSTRPADADHLHALLPGLVFYRMQNPTVSPVPAINFGLSVARGGLVGVCIDGARMASPGLLSKALTASRLHERPVIGTFGFHLGPDVQSESIRHGYNEAAEDVLLAGSGWEADGYRLFSIASFATSSSGGWFALPSESNAFFLRAEHWRALGGWDNGFTSPGGGFANPDTWARACADASASVIMLLGEATFHQIHGGVATNSLDPPLPLYHEEYRRLRGHQYRPPTRQPLFFGSLPDALRNQLVHANGTG
ncbi:MAG TPA: class I SAM-dependent methyltransferase [Acetobacteraceae bacterium]|nr:class I SAM-dependent methyltransferase [Acetobacteraceae bacterium]